MERNPRIFAALQTRALGVTGLRFEVEPSAEGDQRRAKSIAKDLQSLWYEIAPEDVLAELLRSAVLVGVGVAEIVWDTAPARWTPRLYPIHPSLLWWDEWKRAWQVSTGEGVETIVPGDGRWLVLAHSACRPWMRGVVRCLGLEDKVRIEAVKDWARWSERHGTPMLLAKTPARASEDDKKSFYDSLAAVGSGGTTVLVPQGDSTEASFHVELVEATSDGWEGFRELLHLVASDAAIAILGQNLTQETEGGSLAAAKVHDRIRNDLLRADTEVLATALRRDVVIPWVKLNHGADALVAPWPCWDAEVPEDLALTAKTWTDTAAAVAAWRAQGVEPDMRAITERVGLPVASIGEPPPPPTPPPTPSPDDDPPNP